MTHMFDFWCFAMTLRFQNQFVSCICNGQSRNTHARAPARANPDGLCYHYETSTPRFLVPTRTEHAPISPDTPRLSQIPKTYSQRQTSTPRFLVPTRTEISFYYLFLLSLFTISFSYLFLLSLFTISFYYLFLLSFCSMFGDCNKFTVLLKQKMCVSERECCLLVLDCCLLVFIGTRLVLDWYSIQ